jgi:DNA-binding NtrC family response regulator
MRRYAAAHHNQVPELTPNARAYLLAYRWPGNVRELKNVVERVIVRLRHNVVDVGDLPPDILTGCYPTVQEAKLPSTQAQRMYDQMLRNCQSFWTVMYEPFMSRDITREDLRQVVLRGLEHTRGSYKGLVQLFNMVPQDYKRFLNFLAKYQCQIPFQRFRAGNVAPATSSEDERRRSPSIVAAARVDLIK